MKKICSMLLLLMAAFTVQAQLLWKVTGNGLQKPSYIIGTYPLAEASFAGSIKGIKAALHSSRQV